MQDSDDSLVNSADLAAAILDISHVSPIISLVEGDVTDRACLVSSAFLDLSNGSALHEQLKSIFTSHSSTLILSFQSPLFLTSSFHPPFSHTTSLNDPNSIPLILSIIHSLVATPNYLHAVIHTAIQSNQLYFELPLVHVFPALMKDLTCCDFIFLYSVYRIIRTDAEGLYSDQFVFNDELDSLFDIQFEDANTLNHILLNDQFLKLLEGENYELYGSIMRYSVLVLQLLSLIFIQSKNQSDLISDDITQQLGLIAQLSDFPFTVLYDVFKNDLINYSALFSCLYFCELIKLIVNYCSDLDFVTNRYSNSIIQLPSDLSSFDSVDRLIRLCALSIAARNQHLVSKLSNLVLKSLFGLVELKDDSMGGISFSLNYQFEHRVFLPNEFAEFEFFRKLQFSSSIFTISPFFIYKNNDCEVKSFQAFLTLLYSFLDTLSSKTTFSLLILEDKVEPNLSIPQQIFFYDILIESIETELIPLIKTVNIQSEDTSIEVSNEVVSPLIRNSSFESLCSESLGPSLVVSSSQSSFGDCNVGSMEEVALEDQSNQESDVESNVQSTVESNVQSSDQSIDESDNQLIDGITPQSNQSTNQIANQKPSIRPSGQLLNQNQLDSEQSVQFLFSEAIFSLSLAASFQDFVTVHDLSLQLNQIKQDLFNHQSTQTIQTKLESLLSSVPLEYQSHVRLSSPQSLCGTECVLGGKDNIDGEDFNMARKCIEIQYLKFKKGKTSSSINDYRKLIKMIVLSFQSIIQSPSFTRDHTLLSISFSLLQVAFESEYGELLVGETICQTKTSLLDLLFNLVDLPLHYQQLECSEMSSKLICFLVSTIVPGRARFEAVHQKFFESGLLFDRLLVAIKAINSLLIKINDCPEVSVDLSSFQREFYVKKLNSIKTFHLQALNHLVSCPFGRLFLSKVASNKLLLLNFKLIPVIGQCLQLIGFDRDFSNFNSICTALEALSHCIYSMGSAIHFDKNLPALDYSLVDLFYFVLLSRNEQLVNSCCLVAEALCSTGGPFFEVIYLLIFNILNSVCTKVSNSTLSRICSSGTHAAIYRQRLGQLMEPYCASDGASEFEYLSRLGEAGLDESKDEILSKVLIELKGMGISAVDGYNTF
ncbi:hypothetical protein P9112_012300 [Eukaryota sp. TZLM1-RC]